MQVVIPLAFQQFQQAMCKRRFTLTRLAPRLGTELLSLMNPMCLLLAADSDLCRAEKGTAFSCSTSVSGSEAPPHVSIRQRTCY